MGSPNSEAELQEIIDSVHLERGVKAEPLFQKRYALPLFLAVSIGLFNQLSGLMHCCITRIRSLLRQDLVRARLRCRRWGWGW